MGDTKKHISQRGKYTNRACEECRRRRAKCDGRKPSCSRCLQGRISCQYSIAEDGRKPASKKYVFQLRQRIESLERLLEQHGVDTRETTEYEPIVGPKIDSSKNAEPKIDDLDDLADCLKGRLTLDEALTFDYSGEMRYFGPTSGRLQFHENPSEGSNSPAIPTGSEAALETFESFDLANHITTETGFSKSDQDNFIDLYFTWEQPWFAVVDESLFRQSMHNGGRYWSLLLHYCILTLGSRYSGRVDARSEPGDPNSAGMVFFERAKQYLYGEIERPSLTSIQAVTIIGTFYIAMGSDATGWLFHGMAHRLSLDMGLNLDPTKFEETNSLSRREIQLRRQIYWALYCHDKWASSYTGRICSMLDMQSSVKMPEDNEIPDTDIPGKKAFIPLQRAMIKICSIQEKIILSLWAPKPLLKPSQYPSFLRSCLLDLKSWFYDLPVELRVDRPNNVPHAYTLHMIYHTARILLAKPFTAKRKSKEWQATNDEDDETTSLALSSSRESARAIVLVAQDYRQTFRTFELSPISATHCILSAALVLLDETEKLNSTSHKSKLSLCITVLDELSRVWHPAQHIGNNLRKLCLAASNGTFSPARIINHSDGHRVDGFSIRSTNFFDEANSYAQTDQEHSFRSHPDSPTTSLLSVDYGFLGVFNENMWEQMFPQ